MTYLRICDYDDPAEHKAQAFQKLARAIQTLAHATDRIELVDSHRHEYVRGQSRVYCEYDTIYFRIHDLQLATYLAGRDEFRGSWRKAKVVRVLAGL